MKGIAELEPGGAIGVVGQERPAVGRDRFIPRLSRKPLLRLGEIGAAALQPLDDAQEPGVLSERGEVGIPPERLHVVEARLDRTIEP